MKKYFEKKPASIPKLYYTESKSQAFLTPNNPDTALNINWDSKQKICDPSHGLTVHNIKKKNVTNKLNLLLQ